MAQQDRSVLGWFAFVVAVTALALAMFGMRSEAASGASSATASASVDVTLSEFAIAPQMISLPLEGGTLRIKNVGAAVHNFAVPELGLAATDINPGATAEMKVGPAAAGMYQALCEIAGHAANGMTASLMIGEASAGAGTAAGSNTGSAAATPTTMNWQQMDATMADVASKFPAKT
ncbi:MAG: hypothetical protein QOJ74_564, partial [Ilumatobacteraceae bacterium]|nr:hypothetical protein [Ilumatobacteraceae bacterium]